MNCYASETKWLPYNPPNVSLSYRKRSCSIVNTYLKKKNVSYCFSFFFLCELGKYLVKKLLCLVQLGCYSLSPYFAVSILVRLEATLQYCATAITPALLQE